VAGCGDSRWTHVYNPTRLIVKQDCLTVTGTIVNATATQSKHQADGARHEGDGDTHGWLQLDAVLARLQAERDGQVRFPDAGWAEQEDVVAALQIAAGSQVADQVRMDGGWNLKSKASSVF
jgi:hypothetical protein